MSNRLVKNIVHFIAYIILQVMIFKSFTLFGAASCFIYVGFILLYPFDISRIQLMLLSFLMGLIVDIFYDTLGLHAFVSVLLAYLKPAYLKLITPTGGYENVVRPKLKNFGFSWFILYAYPLIILHHLTLYFTEAGGFSHFGYLMIKAFMSSLFTTIVLVIFQYFSSEESRSY